MACLRCHAEIDRNFKACPHCGEPVSDFLRRYSEEPVDGKYRIVERLGAGGMGEVYKVEHVYLGAMRVIKVIRPQISETQEAHDRFLREARLATKVQHPNVATLHDFSALPDGSHYMVWEFIDGQNLAQIMKRRGVLSPREAVRLIVQALQGLEAIHAAGIVHRDISPENLMLTPQGTVKLIDLGVAKGDDGGGSATQTGIFLGKVRYASPEQLGFLADGEKIDGRADLYAIAIVLYELMTGRPPYEATSPHQLILIHSRETEIRPLDLPPDLPGANELQAVLRRALDRNRERRFATAHEMIVALEDVLRTLPDPNDATMATAPPRETLTRTTIRSEVRPQPMAPPLPPPAPTLITPLPAPMPPRRSRAPLWAALIAGVLFLGTAAVVLPYYLFIRGRHAAEPATASASPAPTTPASVPAPQTSVDVVAPTTTTAAPATTITTQTTPPPPPPKPVTPAPRQVEPEPASKPEPAPAPQPAPAATASRTFTEGGDSNANEAAVGELQQALRGVRTVAIEGSGDADLKAQLGKILKDKVTVAASSDTVINFDGTVKHLGRGRKERQAHVTITRNGRTIFRYEMPAETYRVGDNPAEAFARVVSDAFGH